MGLVGDGMAALEVREGFGGILLVSAACKPSQAAAEHLGTQNGTDPIATATAANCVTRTVCELFQEGGGARPGRLWSDLEWVVISFQPGFERG